VRYHAHHCKPHRQRHADQVPERPLHLLARRRRHPDAGRPHGGQFGPSAERRRNHAQRRAAGIAQALLRHRQCHGAGIDGGAARHGLGRSHPVRDRLPLRQSPRRHRRIAGDGNVRRRTRGARPRQCPGAVAAARSVVMAGCGIRRLLPSIFGLSSIALILAAVEILIRAGWINRFIVPLPSDVAKSFGRVIVEEDIFHRFLLTGWECLAAGVLLTVFGVAIGVLLHQMPLFRRACETWVAAMASAPLVLAYPLFLVLFGRSALTIIMLAFIAGLAPVILKTIEGLSTTRRVLINVGRSFKLTPAQQFWKIYFPSALPTIFVGIRLGLIFALINVVGVEFLINFGGLGHLINELAERYDLAGTYAAICFVVLVSVMFFMATERAERWLTSAA